MRKPKTTKKLLIHENTSLTRFLFEQEEDVFADVEEETEDEPADDGGDDAPADDGGGDEPAAEGDDEGEDSESEEEEKLDVEPEEEVKLSKSIDQDLEALLIDFEAQARKSRDIEAQTDEVVIENFHLGMLLEQDETDYEEEIDLDRFTSEVARLVKNYTTLLDMEKMLINKAREFVLTRYGEAAELEMISQLEAKHDISIVAPHEPIDTELEVPIAVGAGAGAAGGAV